MALRLGGRAAWIALSLAGAVLLLPSPAPALLTAPVPIDGPSAEILEIGGVAMAPDGTGGIVYTRLVEGVPHVFASRFLRSGWSAPIRVDADQAYEASEPRIAAGRGGELLVVWVTQVATVHGQVRYGLFSARIGRGAADFQPSLLVDPEVGAGSAVGVDPSLSGTAQDRATVAYRVIAYRFDEALEAAQLRPGDVLSDIRVARLKGDRWSVLGAMNVSRELSNRPPSEANGPAVGAGRDGGAVVAWQESDQSGTARVYLRRIFGTVPGPILQASPSSWEGSPISGDADAFSLAVTPLNQARVAIRVAGNGGAAPVRLFLNTLPASFAVPSSELVGAEHVYTGTADPGSIGMPGVDAYEKGGEEGLLQLGFVAGDRVREAGVDEAGALTGLSEPSGPAATPGSETLTALNPAGGSVIAYPARRADGLPVLAVRQEAASGAAQLGLLTGTQSGPIGGLRIDGAGSGDALIGFRQGEPGHFQIVAERISAPPASFRLRGPKRWIKPRRVKLTWERAESAVGGIRYSVLLGGRKVKRKLRGRAYRPGTARLGNGRVNARVLATDALGQQMLSARLKLRVDGQPPLVRLHVAARGRWVTVRVRDPDSGVRGRVTRVGFGDGTGARRGSRFRHEYERRGRYRLFVSARDRAGNRTVRRFEVRVR